MVIFWAWKFLLKITLFCLLLVAVALAVWFTPAADYEGTDETGIGFCFLLELSELFCFVWGAFTSKPIGLSYPMAVGPQVVLCALAMGLMTA